VRYRSPLAAIAVAGLAAAVTVGLLPGGVAAASQARALARTATSGGTAGCGQAPTLTSGTHTIQSSGQTRSYILELPSNYNTTHPYRLIFAFHWLGGTAQDVDSGGTSGYVWSYYGMEALSGGSTIFVAPQGINDGWANTNGQDITFVQDMLSQFESGLCIDPSEIFSMGFSYGAAMTYALACAMPTVFRAVAVYSGANLSGCSPGTQPVAYIGLHGVEDNVLPIADGRALRDTFVRNNGCTPQNPPEPAPGSLTHIVTAYSGCSAGHPVVWAAFDAGHTPAPVDGSSETSGGGAQTWTKALVWSFFSQFPSTIQGSTVSVTNPGNQSGTVGKAASVQIQASDSASGQTLTYGATGLPAGLSISPSTGLISGTPTTAGTSAVTVTATDGTGVSGSAAFTWTVSPANNGGTCQVTYTTASQWGGGFVANITITNNDTTAISGWTLNFTFPGDQKITNAWDGTASQSGQNASIVNASYNADIPPGANTSLGFQGTWNTSDAAPTAFTLNGTPCTT
jgi:poly(3-hydroxybutyrate) depolymerase